MDEAKKTKAQVEWARLKSKERAGGCTSTVQVAHGGKDQEDAGNPKGSWQTGRRE